MKDNIIFDSSVWIEIFREGPLFHKCKKILDEKVIIGVPTISIYEVYRKILTSFSEEMGLSVVAFLKQFPSLDLTTEIAITASDLSVANKLAMADSVMLAHSLLLNAQLVTLDNDFAGLPNTLVVRKN